MATADMPPGPKGRFFRGNLPDFARDRLGFLSRCKQEYGDYFSLRFGPKRIVVISDPAGIEEVLVTHSRNFTKHFALRLNPLLLGNGLLTSEGDFWLRQRRLAQPAFQRSRIAAYAPVMVEHTRRLMAGWREGETRDMYSEMMRLTVGIAAKTLFGADAVHKAAEVREALTVVGQNFTARFNSFLPVPVWLPTPGNRRLRRAIERLDKIIYGFIKQRRVSGEERGDLLSILLHAQHEDDGSRMTDKQLRDEAMTLFLAGHETTALALSWSWYLIASHSQVEARLVEELRAVVGARFPTAEDLPQLRYHEHVVTEAMRLYPPAYTIGREAIEGCTIGGYRIPEGTTLLLSQWLVHRDARYFEQPEAFRPERWENGLAQRLPKYAYFPFGGGPRLCIGNTFAMMEAVLVLATIAGCYRLTLVPDHPIVPGATFTLRPVHGVKAVLTRRAQP
jgi:cytochrome P450